jgi:hypothetical protein
MCKAVQLLTLIAALAAVAVQFLPAHGAPVATGGIVCER